MNQTDKIEQLLTRGVVNIIPDEKIIRAKLEAGEKLNVYLGIDPTATRIHIGHAVALRKLQQFADLGHNVTFLIGDFTALIGDTSDKNDERPILTSEDIEKNFQSYKKQAEKIIDFSKVKVVHNSDWLNKLTFKEIVELLQHFSVGDFVSREMIRERIQSGKRVGLHETIYPVMQGYDSMHLDTDVQIGGADQTFNMQAGRTLLQDYKGKESIVLVTGYLEGTDGRKMSKSWGNAIWIEDEPKEMYGKLMSLRDELIPNYLKLATDLYAQEIEEIISLSKTNPMEAKKKLALRVTMELHSLDAAQEAQKYFEETFQNKSFSEISTVSLNKKSVNIIILITEMGYANSNSEAKRLIAEKAVEIDGETVNDTNHLVTLNAEGVVLKVGKKRIVKIKYEE